MVWLQLGKLRLERREFVLQLLEDDLPSHVSLDNRTNVPIDFHVQT